MSHNYPYRGSTSDTDLRPEAGHYSSANRRHISPDLDFCRSSQETFSSSYPSSSSSRGSTPAQWAQDSALSILSSCGLEPSDLALLAKLPEDVLTVESLPHVLKQIKGKRGTFSSFPPSTLSPSMSYSYHQASVSSSRVRDQVHSQPIQYPLNHVAPSSLPSDHDRWRNSRTISSVRCDPTPSSASRFIVDFHHRTGPSDYGKTGKSAGAFSSQDRSSFTSTRQGRSSRPIGFSEPSSAPPPEVYHPKPWVGCNESQTSSTRSSSWQTTATSIPSEKEALDFHGTCPTVFPYSCSLCDITVLSEKVWIKHINGTQHAEGQLSLLQQFPNWDCRMESLSRAKNPVEKKDEKKMSCSPQTATKNHKPKPETKCEKKTSEKGKVVCVKFPPQTVDEAYLKKLTEPFGKIIQILRFPSLAFLELDSTDQAKELVKFHVNYPPTVNGEQIEFSISNTFNFVQSAQVVSFCPVPRGEDGQSDLICIVKRFGPPLYSLFLPSTAFVEMKNAPDAQKMVDYYSSNTLRINNTCIKVSFSGEYKTLMRVPSAKKYEEENILSKRTRSSSPEKEVKTESKRRRSNSKDREQEQRKSSTERRARSRERSSKERRTRSRDKWIRSSSVSRDESNKSNRDRKARSRSKDKSREKPSRGSRTRSKSREKSNTGSKTRSRSREKSLETEKPETESGTEDEQGPRADAPDKQHTEGKVTLSTEDSDIEEMEVIGEDEENVDEEYVKNLNDPDREEEEAAAERINLLEEDKEVEVKAENEEEQECGLKKPEEESEAIEEAAETRVDCEEESHSPVDLKNCITLDELEDNQSENQGEDVTGETESLSSRVVYFRDLPVSYYADSEFIKLVKDFGRAVRYLLICQNQEGFIEMSSSSEAQRAAQELSHKPVALNGSKLFVSISHQYQRLSNGREIHLDSGHEERSESQSSIMRSEQQSTSKTPDTEKTHKKSGGTKESSKKTPDEGSGYKTSANEESASEIVGDKESSDEKTPQEESDRMSPEEAITKNMSEKTNARKPDKRSKRNTAEEELMSEKTKLLHETCQVEDTRKSIPENDPDLKKESDGEESQTENKKEGSTETPECDENFSQGQRAWSEEETLKTAGDSPHSPNPQTAQKPDNEDQLRDFDTVKLEQGPGPGPAEGAAEPDKPTKPVGTEFVRPVVGYFCNLCQLIYADEDEAKLQHCSSLMHYRKYQEKTGKDPWTS